MALSDSQRSRIAQLKIQMESVSKNLENYKQTKKSINERYSGYIKNTKDANQKRNYRMSKIREINSVAQQISNTKQQIENIKRDIAYIKQ
jgi:predicted RNase H-like nuclease (RuvC/YqgF family)